MHIKVQDLSKHYGKYFSLRIPLLEIAQGQTFGLVGNNGAGKTTFLRLLLDLIEPDTGSVYADGKETARSFEWKQHVGSYLDESFLIDFLTPREFFDFIGSIYGVSKHHVEEQLDIYQTFFTGEILRTSTTYIRDLSMGNKKKVGIVAAMLVEPRLIILDEPFANLDPGSQIRLKEMLLRLNAEHGTTLLISSHDLGHVTDVCRRIAILDDGAIVRDLQTSDATLRELQDYFAMSGGPGQAVS